MEEIPAPPGVQPPPMDASFQTGPMQPYYAQAQPMLDPHQKALLTTGVVAVLGGVLGAWLFGKWGRKSR